MKEELLHYVWNFKLFNSSNLKTQNQEEIKIIKSGQHNTNAGPDFFNAQIQINDTLWAGNIEIHINASDWNKHQHQKDSTYDNVILHVVFDADCKIFNSKNQQIPTLELKSIISPNVIDNYQYLVKSKGWIACENQIQLVDSFTINNWMQRLAFERLERKSLAINEVLLQNKNDWESTFYQLLFKYFGLKVNELPFEMLAKNTPLKIIDKHKTLPSIEALLFGQAGFLNHANDDYQTNLQKEYLFLRNKFNLQTLDENVWKFLRLRPYNFPTIRIAQLSAILKNNSRLFNKVISAKSINEVKNLFAVAPSKYWDDHFKFGEVSKVNRIKKIGEQTILNIIINVVVPLIFVYGKSINNEELVNKSLQWLEQIKPETNSIITRWKKINIQPKNALETQSLLQLKNNYCSEKKCLNCSIGNKLLKQ